MNDLPTLQLPVIHSANESKDTLPLRGYTTEQLTHYIMRQLGAPTWNVELTVQQVQDCIRDSISKFSLYKPVLCWGALPMVAGQKKYLENQDVGQGIAEVTFVENRLGVLNLDFSNPFTTMSIMTTGLGLDGMGDYDSYLRWQKTWMRVTSTMPQWQYDDVRRCLWIHNPIARYRAAVLAYANYANCESLSQFGAEWVKEFALAKARHLLGDVWLKFSGAIPGPAQNIQLDNAKRDAAVQRMNELEQQLRNAQELTPLSQD